MPLHLSPQVERLRRCLRVGNPITVKLAVKDISTSLDRMSCVDLVNIVKIAPDYLVLTKNVLEEFQRRKWKSFNGNDFAVLLSSLNSSDRIEVLQSLSTASIVASILPDMRTTDICIVLKSISGLPGSEPVLKAGVETLTQTKRLEQLNTINMTQLLYVLSRNFNSISRIENVALLANRLKEIAMTNTRSLPNESIPFIIHSVNRIRDIRGFDLNDFYESMSREMLERTEMKPLDVIDSCRALNRVGELPDSVIRERLTSAIRSVDRQQLSEEKRKGIETLLPRIQNLETS
jgi:hypothetical protein